MTDWAPGPDARRSVYEHLQSSSASRTGPPTPAITATTAARRLRRYLAATAAAQFAPSTTAGTPCRSSRSSRGATSASSSVIAKNDENMSMSTNDVLTHKRETTTADGRRRRRAAARHGRRRRCEWMIAAIEPANRVVQRLVVKQGRRQGVKDDMTTHEVRREGVRGHARGERARPRPSDLSECAEVRHSRSLWHAVECHVGSDAGDRNGEDLGGRRARGESSVVASSSASRRARAPLSLSHSLVPR